MDGFRQDRIADEENFGKAAPEPDQTTAAPEVSLQPSMESVNFEPTVQNVELPQLQMKPRKKRWLIALMVFLALGVIGGTAWFVLANSGSSNEPGEVTDEGNEGKDSSSNKEVEAKPDPEDAIVELSLDDELVRQLYNHFNVNMNYEGFNTGGVPYGFMSSFSPLDKFYTENGGLSPNGLGADYMVAFSLQRFYYSSESRFCQNQHEFQFGDTKAWTAIYKAGESGCLDGEKVRKWIYDVFGKKVASDVFGMFENTDLIIAGEGYRYVADEDAFLNIASGAARQLISRCAYAAERDDTHIYISEMVGYVGPATYGAEYEVRKLDGTVLDSGESAENRSMLDFKEQLDKFKWTFVWNGENYVFEKLERVPPSSSSL